MHVGESMGRLDSLLSENVTSMLSSLSFNHIDLFP